MFHTIRDIDVEKESPVVEKPEESSFYLTALASATSQPVKAKSLRKSNPKIAGIEPKDIPVLKISGRSSGTKSDSVDEGDDDDDDDDDDYYEDDEDDDNNGYDDEDYDEDEDEDGGNQNGRSYIGLDTSEWRDIAVATKTSSPKVDPGDANEPADPFIEPSLDVEVSNTLTDKNAATYGKEKEMAVTLSLVETIRRTSNYDNVFTLK